MGQSSISRELFRVTEPSSWKPWLIASLAAIVILGIALGLMKFLGLFDIPKDDTGAKTLAAALALVGSVLAAALTLVGTVVKYSIDDRNARLAFEAERRNRIEAAIRAVDLLSENNKDATQSQIGGAILALVSLGELNLAVALLAQLWPTGLASPYVADAVLTAALKNRCEDTQVTAGAVLSQNAEQIQQRGFHIWPISGLGWRADLPEDCRIFLVRAAAQWLKSELVIDKHVMPDAAVVLYRALKDPSIVVADVAAASLRPLVQALPEASGLYVGEILVSIAEIARRLNEFPLQPKTGSGARIGSEIRELLAPPVGEVTLGEQQRRRGRPRTRRSDQT